MLKSDAYRKKKCGVQSRKTVWGWHPPMCGRGWRKSLAFISKKSQAFTRYTDIKKTWRLLCLFCFALGKEYLSTIDVVLLFIGIHFPTDLCSKSKPLCMKSIEKLLLMTNGYFSHWLLQCYMYHRRLNCRWTTFEIPVKHVLFSLAVAMFEKELTIP